MGDLNLQNTDLPPAHVHDTHLDLSFCTIKPLPEAQQHLHFEDDKVLQIFGN